MDVYIRTLGTYRYYYLDNPLYLRSEAGGDGNGLVGVTGCNFNVPSGTFITGKWNHYVVTYSSSAARFYINNQLIGSRNNCSSLTFSQNFYIGYYTYYSPNAWIDDFRIYNKALSEAEIQAIYNATK